MNCMSHSILTIGLRDAIDVQLPYVHREHPHKEYNNTKVLLLC